MAHSPVAKEQALLETFFQCISKFAYDKAKELAEKERDAVNKSQPGSTWGSIVTCLVQFALAEKAYGSLIFLGIGHSLGQKLGAKLGRKDSLKITYSSISSDLRSLEEHSLRNPRSSLPSQEQYMEELLGHLCGQLAQYIHARISTVEFYEQMWAMAHYRNMSCEDLRVVITDIITDHTKNFHHPILSAIKSSFSLECDIIRHLLQAQMQLQDVEFMPSLLQLHDAHTKLTAWGQAGTPVKEEKKFGFGSSSRLPPLPNVYQWLNKYKGLLVSKFSLYFYSVLSKQAPAQEVSKMAAKCSVDLYGKVVQFHKKSDAINVSLVLDTYDPDHQKQQPYCPGGYRHPDKFREEPKGLDSYPPIFTYPGERPDKHWPSVVSMVGDRATDVHGVDKIAYFYDEKFSSTYFLTRVDPRITFVVIFEAKKSEKDSYVNNFFNDICGHLRCTKLFT